MTVVGCSGKLVEWTFCVPGNRKKEYTRSLAALHCQEEDFVKVNFPTKAVNLAVLDLGLRIPAKLTVFTIGVTVNPLAYIHIHIQPLYIHIQPLYIYTYRGWPSQHLPHSNALSRI